MLRLFSEINHHLNDDKAKKYNGRGPINLVRQSVQVVGLLNPSFIVFFGRWIVIHSFYRGMG
jgi:hypothetical protein